MPRGALKLEKAELSDLIHRDVINSITVAKVLKHHNLVPKWQQVRYWEEYGLVKTVVPKDGGKKLLFSQQEFRKIWFLAHLVNNLGLSAAKSHKLAEKIAETSFTDTRPILWVQFRGLTVGIPNIIAEAVNGNLGH